MGWVDHLEKYMIIPVVIKAQRKFIDWKKTKLFRFRWNWDEEKKLRGIRLQISSPSTHKESSPQPVPPLVLEGVVRIV